MDKITTFEHEQFGSIRTVLIDSNPYFVGKNVAKILGYTNTRSALATHVDEEDKVGEVTICDAIGREQKPVLISENGLYSLIFSSKLPAIKEIQKWITSKVLPAARKLQAQSGGTAKTPESVKKGSEISDIAPANNDFVAINGYQLSVKEYRGQRVVTFRDIDEIHRRPAGTARRNFNTNRKYFRAGEDFFKVCAHEIRMHNIVELSTKAQEDITLITESGYAMLVKSFTDALSWAIQRKLVDTYFHVQKMFETPVPIENLSPHLQMFHQLFCAVAEMQQNALAAKQMSMEAKQDAADAKQQVTMANQTSCAANQKAEEAKQQSELISQEVSGIRTVVTYHPGQTWRKESNAILADIARTRGGGSSMYAQVHNECYALVDARAKSSLQTRLTNKQNRMRKEGASKTQCGKLTKLDILEEDPRLLEIYIAVIKEMAIQYGVNLPERFGETEVPTA